MDAEEALGYEYEEVTDSGVVLREQRAGYSTRGYNFDDATYRPSTMSKHRVSSWACC